MKRKHADLILFLIFGWIFLLGLWEAFFMLFWKMYSLAERFIPERYLEDPQWLLDFEDFVKHTWRQFISWIS